MNEKSNKELLSIIKIRNEYQLEAAEAAIKIALQRGIIDSYPEELKRESESSEVSVSSEVHSSFLEKIIAIIIFLFAAYIGSRATSGNSGDISILSIIITIAISFGLMRFAINLWK